MSEEERIAELELELEEFRKEKEKVRKILGKIGGVGANKKNTYINLGFLIVVLIIFFLGIFHIINFVVSLELGILLVSLKIGFMIYEQQRVNHFLFWILSSLEHKVNEVHKKVINIEKEQMNSKED